jgi:hypothetical protein
MKVSRFPMKPMNDSDAAIRGKLKPGRHRVAKSLYLNVTPQQGKSWVLRTVVNGKRRELGIGSYPDLSLAKAREEAAGYRLTARRGVDPAAERDARHADSTIEIQIHCMAIANRARASCCSAERSPSRAVPAE